ncbi:MAG: methylated-DNA--[protein]-cysteine S-methyltransferase [Phycisphaerae bacterium]|nr:methylated-DNA--[protein]-cysteine S-methyltransferase [Gemmatimonadaceae bacterium]
MSRSRAQRAPILAQLLPPHTTIQQQSERDHPLSQAFSEHPSPRPEMTTNSLHDRMLALARFIDEHVDESLPLSRLARESNTSPYHLQRTFKAVLGVSPKVYQTNARLRALKSSLRDGDSVSNAIISAGFGSTSRVYEQVDGGLGMTPSAYRAGGAGEHIAYAVRQTALGTVLMAATARGVCFVHFGESESSLFDALRTEYPNALLARSTAEHAPALDGWIDALNAHVSDRKPPPDIPLDLRGTAFQLRVWRFLLSIKDGDVVSYTEAAVGIGQPSAVRAAASACGANNVAVLVPCHRVLRGDGGLGGYRWGVERKRTLLDGERRTR